jgi:hypothetical protein
MMLFKPGTTDFADAVRTDQFTALQQFGAQVVEGIQTDISVPVVYSIGPRGGLHVERSQPGEPPRREFSNLHDSFTPAVESDGGLILLDVSSSCPYALHLEEGSGRVAPRPYLLPAFDSSFDDFVDRMVAAVQGA